MSRSEMRVGTIDSLTREEVQLELQRIRQNFERDVIDISPSAKAADEEDRKQSLEFLETSAGDDAETTTADAN